MKRIIFFVSLFGAANLFCQTTNSKDWTTYGRKIAAIKFVPVGEALKDAPAEGRSVAVEGVIYIMTASGVAIEKGGAISKEQRDVIDGKKKKEEH